MTTLNISDEELNKYLQDIKIKYYLYSLNLPSIKHVLEEGYSLEQLNEFIIYNTTYIYNNYLSVQDVKKYYELKEEIENRTKVLQAGDIIEIHSNNNKIFYKYGFVENASHTDSGLTYCEQPSTPFYNNKIFSASGGAWGTVHLDKCTFLCKDYSLFKTWGRGGAKGNGAFNIYAKVNRYKMDIDRKYIPFVIYNRNVIYGKDYKFYFEKRDKKSVSICSSAFVKVNELKEFLRSKNLRIGKRINCNINCHEIIGDYNED